MKVKFLLALFISAFLSVPLVAQAQAMNSAREEAKWLLERLTGVKWSGQSAVLTEMTDLVAKGQRKQAAQLATQQPQFLNVVVRQLASKMSTREETIRAPFNDFAASFMGVARDGTDARELLYGNFYYMANPATITASKIPSDLVKDILQSNNHYNALNAAGIDIGSNLVRVDAQNISIDDKGTALANPDPAGVLTSRAFLEAHATAGTNRRLVEYTFRQFMCVHIEEWADPLANESRIGRDIDRFPGGDNQTFQSTCRACHTGMDGFRGAFARYDFSNNRVVNALLAGDADGNKVVRKMNQNNTVYPGGYVTVDDSWINNADGASNAATFGWRKPASDIPVTSGKGVNAFGRLVANSQRFSQCVAQRVFDTVCKKELAPSTKAAMVVRLGSQFEQSNYSLRKLFVITATDVQCK